MRIVPIHHLLLESETCDQAKSQLSEGTNPVVEVLLINGAALVNMLKPNGVCKTFSDYVDHVYLPLSETSFRW